MISIMRLDGATPLSAIAAATYLGRQTEISGSDLDGEAGKLLQQMAAEITAEYGKQLNPEPAQLLYDTITDHSRNEVVVKDAVAAAIKNISIASPQPTNQILKLELPI